MQFKNRHHYILMGISLLAAVVCAVLMFHVNVNSDMTKYLPDDSQMKKGLDIIQTEFQSEQLRSADIKVMFKDLTPAEQTAYADSLRAFPEVEGIVMQKTDDGKYTLYELVAPNVVDLKMFAHTIARSFDNEVAIETVQDGATPPISVLIIAAVLIFIVLIVMAQSWLDPVLSLATIGIAIVINIGTNALLPSVSITTNYIVAILQMVLSLDYSIVLMNRYRQELDDTRTPTQSINAAIHRAYPSILSSAATTIVGLLVLVFMRLKIGMDLGLVLAKGVACCLICTFTVLPSLLMLCRKGLEKTAKKSFVIPTDRLSRFATGHKISLAIFAFLLFITAFYFSRKIEISFSTNGESKIAKVFPRLNPFVVVYDRSDEQGIFALADSLIDQDGVRTIISYPTLLQKQLTAEEMVTYVGSLSAEFGDFMPGAEYNDMLTPEVLRILYTMRDTTADELQVTFPAMMQFVAANCVDNPLFADYIDESMKQQMALLRPLLQSESLLIPEEEPETEEVMLIESDDDEEYCDEEEEYAEGESVDMLQDDLLAQDLTQADTTPQFIPEPEPVVEEVHVVEPIAEPVKAEPVVPKVPDHFSIVEFMNILNDTYADDDTRYLASIVDTARLNRPMGINEMADFVGSTRTQTRMVYTISTKKEMTPIDYVHFLADDLFNRKGLAPMVNAEQRSGLLNVKKIMDYAEQNSQLTPAQLSTLLNNYGLLMDEEQVLAVALINYPVQEEVVSDALLAEEEDTIKEFEPQKELAVVEIPSKETIVEEEPTPSEDSASVETAKDEPQPIKRITPLKKADKVGMKSNTTAQKKADDQAERFLNLLASEKTYTPEQMANNFKGLGQTIETPMVQLLYMYYASVNQYDTTLCMTPEQLLTFVADDLVNDSYVSDFIPDDVRDNTSSIKLQLDSAVAMLNSDTHGVMLILTDMPDESKRTYRFVDKLQKNASESLEHPYYLVGESVMFSEMKDGFSDELTKITWLTIIAIFVIVAISFRSLVVPAILVMTVMTAVFVNVIFSGLASGQILYLAYLIVQSILMGATIDYGILFANYYKENRKTLPKKEAAAAAYKGSIRTIMTSGLIMILGPGMMAIFIDDLTISSIVGCLAVGAAVAIALILVVLPAVLVALDRWVLMERKPKIKIPKGKQK